MGMRETIRRLQALRSLTQPLAITLVGIVLLSLGVGYVLTAIYKNVEVPAFFYYLTLQFLETWQRALLFLLVGTAVLLVGMWQLSAMAVIPLNTEAGQREVVLGLGYRKEDRPPRIVVLSGGAGMFIFTRLIPHLEHLTCITPLQDPVEYYYRASSLLSSEHVEFVPPTPLPAQIMATLDEGTKVNIKQIRQIARNPLYEKHHVAQLSLQWNDANHPSHPLAHVVVDAISKADAIILGPGSLFESILPNLLIPELREAIKASRARKIYVCNLMTEPGLTTGFGVAEHLSQIRTYGGFSPDYVLVNAQRIEPEVQQMYLAAHQSPVYLSPEEYEETSVSATDRVTRRQILVEGAVVIEADLASSQLQLTASLDRPGEGRTVRVLRHDPDKLAAAILEILRRG